MLRRIFIPKYFDNFEYSLERKKSCFACDAFLPLPNLFGLDKYPAYSNLLFTNHGYNCLLKYCTTQYFGQTYYKSTIICFLPGRNFTDLFKILRRSEYHVAILLLQNLSDDQIAYLLKIHKGTVRKHISNISDKLFIPQCTRRRFWLMKYLLSDFVIKEKK